MKVTAHQPHVWFLLKDGDAYYLDVNCNVSACSFDIVIKLNQEEFREYHGLGLVYIEYLAARVNYWSQEYWPRNCADLAAPINEAEQDYMKNGAHDS